MVLSIMLFSRGVHRKKRMVSFWCVVGLLPVALWALSEAGPPAISASTPLTTPDVAAHHLTQAQWQALFDAAGKRMVTLRLEAIVQRKFYITSALAAQITKGVRRMFPTQTGRYTASPGNVIMTQLVRLDWDVPLVGLVKSRKIQVGGEVDVSADGKLHTELAHASIWVVGHHLFWHAFPGGGVWNVTIGRRSGAWFTGAWPYKFRDLGLFDISVYWVPFATPIVPANGVAKLPLSYRLVSQKIDRSSGLITLTYLELYKGKVNFVPGIGTCEYIYVLRLAGGMRIYRKVYEAVGGPKGTVRFFEADFKKFVMSGGVWFPTRIHECNWPNGAKQAQPDETITIQHVVVNGAFPPHTFRYQPPFGAMVTDARTNPPSVYFIGSKNPKVPPTTAPTTHTNGGK